MSQLTHPITTFRSHWIVVVAGLLALAATTAVVLVLAIGARPASRAARRSRPRRSRACATTAVPRKAARSAPSRASATTAARRRGAPPRRFRAVRPTAVRTRVCARGGCQPPPRALRFLEGRLAHASFAWAHSGRAQTGCQNRHSRAAPRRLLVVRGERLRGRLQTLASARSQVLVGGSAIGTSRSQGRAYREYVMPLRKAFASSSLSSGHSKPSGNSRRPRPCTTG